MSKTYSTDSLSELNTVAAEMAAKITAPALILLSGDLGAGKTTFAQYLIRHLTEDPGVAVTSPTFNMVHTYDSPKGTIWHLDLYRLANPQDIIELGIYEALEGIAIIEWPEICADFFEPLDATRIKFFVNGSKRWLEKFER